MRYQELEYSCGAAAVVNALRTFGQRVDERRVRSLASTDVDGTADVGIINALRTLGYNATTYNSTARHHAWRWLHGALLQGSTVILSVDLWQHWVACIGLAGDRVILADSARIKSNLRENGVHVLSKDRLLRRWRSSRKSADNVFFAICVSKTKK